MEPIRQVISSEYTRHNRKLNFRFYMYDKNVWRRKHLELKKMTYT